MYIFSPVALSTFTWLCNHHYHPALQFFHLPQLNCPQRSFKPGWDAGESLGLHHSPCPPRAWLLWLALPFLPPSLLQEVLSPPPTSPPPRLQKILAESPPPARLDIQLPVISDDFKFQVWRKMFRALMPGTGRGSLWVCVCNCVVGGSPPSRGAPIPSGHPRRCPRRPSLGVSLHLVTCAQRRALEGVGFQMGD